MIRKDPEARIMSQCAPRSQGKKAPARQHMPAHGGDNPWVEVREKARRASTSRRLEHDFAGKRRLAAVSPQSPYVLPGVVALEQMIHEETSLRKANGR
jgi:hypothetical protein